MLCRAVELTARKKALIEEIQLLTSGQSDVLATDKTEQLLSLIGKKQNCINEINKVDAEVPRLEEKIINAAGISSQDEIKKIFYDKWQEIEKMRYDTTLILQETQRLDEQNRRKIDEEYCRLKSDMESLHARKGTVKAYQTSAAQKQGYFIDKKN
ncbi:MAG: hypothetical protein A4E55_00647 [Pelotomaculum sp. PtaU1.Bin035]|nr:MAG: hypothetical protein A4E55_00647 [Pelotomaculum sp. PtaU1.Bin035]